MEDKLKQVLVLVNTINELSIAGADVDSYLDEVMEELMNDSVTGEMLLEIQKQQID